MNSENPQKSWDVAITLLSRPRLLLQGAIEYLLAWSFTRGWWRLLLIHSLPLLLLLSSVGVVGYGVLLSRSALVERYDAWVGEELPEALRQLSEDAGNSTGNAGDATTDDTSADDTSADVAAQPASGSQGSDSQTSLDALAAPDGRVVSRYGELLLRRLLQLQGSNSRITYLVADQLARQNRLGQARQMMRRIAPADGKGFLPAHAWLAIEQLRGGPITTIADRDRLLHNLELATQWSGSPAGLYNLHAKMLENQGESGQAMSVLERLGTQQSSVQANLQIAELAAKSGLTGRLQRAADAVKRVINPRRENKTATAEDLAALANVLLFELESQAAREIAQEGLQMDPKNPQLLRLLSESYRLEYLQSITNTNGKTEVKLSLLDAALKADPTNPAVGIEIARLMNVGQGATAELKAALEQQLGAGHSTALTHILLANRALQANDLTVAEPHLELALRHAPNNPTIMNNLALVLARGKPDQMQRALQLSMAACQISPTSGQFRDTLGEIRARAGDKLGAIESYEAAIGLQGDLMSARQRLAELYRELGMTDMADVQLRELAKLRTQSQPPPADSQSATPTLAPTLAPSTDGNPQPTPPESSTPATSPPADSTPADSKPADIPVF